MKENKISVIIEKPIEKVFEFTTNPNNTHIWIPSILEGISSAYPPRLKTIYRIHNENNEWDFYEVTELIINNTFTLKKIESSYHLKYTYKKVDKNNTEITFNEWVEEEEMKTQITKKNLTKLKEALENKLNL